MTYRGFSHFLFASKGNIFLALLFTQNHHFLYFLKEFIMIKQTVHCKTILFIFAVGLFIIGVTNIGNTDSYFVGVGSTDTRSVDENAAVGTNVGAAFSAKNICFDPVRFILSGHNDKFKFEDSTEDYVNYSVQIKTKVSLDYETTSSYTVTLILQYYDYLFGRWIEDDRVTVTININDVTEETTTDVTSGTASTADALPTLTNEERERITSLLTLDSIIFNELFNASNDPHDWIEFRNVTDADVDLSGWRLIVITSEKIESLGFPIGTVLPAGELLLFLNTDPNAPDMPLATSEEPSYHYLVDERFALPQEDFILLLRSLSAWEDSAGSYRFGHEKLSTTVDFGLDTVWFRANPSVYGHNAEAWRVNGYQGGSVMTRGCERTAVSVHPDTRSVCLVMRMQTVLLTSWILCGSHLTSERCMSQMPT